MTGNCDCSLSVELGSTPAAGQVAWCSTVGACPRIKGPCFGFARSGFIIVSATAVRAFVTGFVDTALIGAGVLCHLDFSSTFSAALHIGRRCSQGMGSALLPPKCVLATVDVVLGSLLHLMDVVAGIFHVLLAECTDHKLDLPLHGSQGQREDGIGVPALSIIATAKHARPPRVQQNQTSELVPQQNPDGATGRP
jgi:hypothetical protein